jgi:hypothetical protein
MKWPSLATSRGASTGIGEDSRATSDASFGVIGMTNGAISSAQAAEPASAAARIDIAIRIMVIHSSQGPPDRTCIA